MNRDDVVFYSICVVFFSGSVGVCILDVNSLSWTFSGLLAMLGYTGIFAAIIFKIVRIILRQ